MRTKDNIIKELKDNTKFQEDQNLTSGVVFYIRKRPDFLQDLKSLTKYDSNNEAELLYRLIHPEEKGVCEVCGEPTKFVAFYCGYKKACCKKHADMLSVKRCAETKEERYGDPRYNNIEKNKATKLERYGDENYTNQEKGLATRLERYGTLSYNNIEKNKQTCLERYGVENVMYLPENLEKMKATNLEKRGVEYPMHSELVKQHYMENYIEKTGYAWPFKNPEFKAEHPSTGKTSNEKKIEEFLKNRGFSYQYQYPLNGKLFDFVIFDGKGNLSIVIETDGKYFHGLLSDVDGFHVRGEKDCERFLKIPEGVKFLAADENNTEELLREILRILDIDYDQWIDEIISSLPKDFPYYNYSEERLRKDYKHLCEYSEVNPKGRLADSTIKNFHKSIYHAHVGKYPSPFEAWSDRELLRRCVENRFVYSSDLSSHSILGGFNVCKLAPKVSVFSASLSKYLVGKYLKEYIEVFDPFSGFSGRMLGVCALDKKYIGQDINTDHVRESNEIIKFHNFTNASVIQKDILQSSGEYECLFTCPPYSGKEHWNDLNNEVEKSCDEWIGECLKRFKCKKYLFVVDETEKYKDNIVETIKNQSHFGTKEEKVILI